MTLPVLLQKYKMGLHYFTFFINNLMFSGNDNLPYHQDHNIFNLRSICFPIIMNIHNSLALDLLFTLGATKNQTTRNSSFRNNGLLIRKCFQFQRDGVFDCHQQNQKFLSPFTSVITTFFIHCFRFIRFNLQFLLLHMSSPILPSCLWDLSQKHYFLPFRLILLFYTFFITVSISSDLTYSFFVSQGIELSHFLLPHTATVSRRPEHYLKILIHLQM